MCTCHNSGAKGGTGVPPVTGTEVGTGVPPVSRTTAKSLLKKAAGWAAPTITLLLIPKCPACLAAYVALWTGLGLSLPAAARIRTALIALCITSLILLALTQLRRISAYARSRLTL
jgi:hypothetical protein